MASKVFTIIYGAELGKFVVLPNILGRSSVRNYESAASRRYDKKRMSVCCDKKIHNKLPTSYPFRLG